MYPKLRITLQKSLWNACFLVKKLLASMLAHYNCKNCEKFFDTKISVEGLF